MEAHESILVNPKHKIMNIENEHNRFSLRPYASVCCVLSQSEWLSSYCEMAWMSHECEANCHGVLMTYGKCSPTEVYKQSAMQNIEYV